MGALGGPIGVPIAAALGAAGGFTAGFLGAALGHWWDEPAQWRESGGSAALYTTVTSGVLAAIVFGLLLGDVRNTPDIFERAVFGISALSAFLASMSRSLIDDFLARHNQAGSHRSDSVL
jgi:hypothetical protein